MRLLNTKSIRLEEFYSYNTPLYTTLSYTLDKEEVSFQDLAGETHLNYIGIRKLSAAVTRLFLTATAISRLTLAIFRNVTRTDNSL